MDQADGEDVFETLKDSENGFHVSETFPGKFKGEVNVEEGQWEQFDYVNKGVRVCFDTYQNVIQNMWREEKREGFLLLKLESWINFM